MLFVNFSKPQRYAMLVPRLNKIAWNKQLGYHAQGVPVAVSNKLNTMTIVVTPVNEHIMRLKIPHFLGVISLVCICSH